MSRLRLGLGLRLGNGNSRAKARARVFGPGPGPNVNSGEGMARESDWRGLFRTAVLAAMVVLGACGGGGGSKQGKVRAAPADSARAAPPVEAQACQLVPLAEVAAITGLELKLGEKTADYLGYSRCQWDPTAGKPTGILLVTNESGQFSDYSNVPGATPVQGLGLEAVWNPRVRQLAVRREKGTLSVSFLSDPAQRPWAEKIARAALGAGR